MDELIARFTLENPEEIKTVFSVNLTPSKVSQLENDLDFVRKEEVNLPDVDFDEFATKQEVENISTQKVDTSDFENTIDDINSALETKQPKGDYASPNDIPDVSNLATKDELADKANNNDVVHKDGTETITGVKTFNGRVNLLGNGDANAVYLSENTRINVDGTVQTVLGFASGTYLIGHSNYNTLIRGKGERPYWGTGANISTAKTLALISDIPDISNLASKTEVMQMIASIPQFSLKVVNELPVIGEKMTLYLVPKEGSDNDIYNEYVWIEELQKFEHLGTTAVDLTGYIKNKEAMTDSIVIGNTSTASNAIVIGLNQRATGRYSIAMGEDCSLSNTRGISVGRSNYLNGTSNIAIGNSLTTSGSNAIAIGSGSYPNTSAGGGDSIAIGTSAQATGSQSIALGRVAKATQDNAIQLGIGTNNTADTFQVWDYQLLNKADGKIPIERLPFQTITQADYDALETKDANTLYLIEEENA